MGTDHVHLHIHASPDYSAYAIVNQVIQHSQTYLKETFSELFDKNEIFFEKVHILSKLSGKNTKEHATQIIDYPNYHLS